MNYRPAEVVRLASRYLEAAQIPLVMVATLRAPDAFTVEGGEAMLESQLAGEMLRIAREVVDPDPPGCMRWGLCEHVGDDDG